MTLRFLLVCEGSADIALEGHIRKLLVNLGHHDPQGSHWTQGRSLTDKVRNGLKYSGECDLLLVHRDSDSIVETTAAGPEHRRSEIRDAIGESPYAGVWASIVPVRMTEAWLLVDEAAIRTVVGRPHGNESIELPALRDIEGIPSPKDVLTQALLSASGATGRRLRRIGRDLPQLRRQLLEDLPVRGLLEQVPSWARFRNELASALVDI